MRPRMQLLGRACYAGPTTFSPVVLETLGSKSASIGPTQEFLTEIVRRLTEVTTDPRETAFLVQGFSVAVQRFNAT